MTDLLKIGSYIIPVKVAISEQEYIQGLMNQINPYPMAFPYTKSQVISFWMKDTPAPLDIIFCNQGKITKIAQGKPYSENRIIGFGDLVVELPSNQYSLQISEVVNLSYSIITLANKYQYSLRTY